MSTRVIVALITSTVVASGSHALAQTTTRVSVSTGGVESDAACRAPAISDDGTTVVFTTSATTLAAGDPNHQDVYMRDLDSGVTSRISVPIGASAGDCYFPSISADGDWITFSSGASNFVLGDTNASSDIFLFDRGANSLSRISLNSAGMQGVGGCEFPDISPDGTFISFAANCTNFDALTPDTNNATDVFVRDLGAQTTQRISVRTVSGVRTEANGSSDWTAISAGGNFVAFSSHATNLTSATDTNGSTDVFLWDSSGGIVLVSHGFGGVPSDGASTWPSISADGRYVVFTSTATNLLPTSLTDSNSGNDVFLWDRVNDTIELVSVNSAGTGTGDSYSGYGSISKDGLFISYFSQASDLVADDTNTVTDVFLYDRVNRTTERLSYATPYVQASGGSESMWRCGVSAGGTRTTFFSYDSALDPDSPDSNAVEDVFVRERCGLPIVLQACPPGVSSHGCQATISASGWPSVDPGSTFTITASNVEGNRSGFIFYSPTPTNLPYGPTSRLCVAAPSKGKGAPMLSGGNTNACNGSIFLVWNLFNASNPWNFGQYPSGFTSGATIYAQCWYRDPAIAPKFAQLSDAIEFRLCP